MSVLASVYTQLSSAVCCEWPAGIAWARPTPRNELFVQIDALDGPSLPTSTRPVKTCLIEDRGASAVEEPASKDHGLSLQASHGNLAESVAVCAATFTKQSCRSPEMMAGAYLRNDSLIAIIKAQVLG